MMLPLLLKNFGTEYSMISPGDRANGRLVNAKRLVSQLAAQSALCLLLVTAAGGSQAAGDAAAGEQKAYTCLGCHGVKHYVNTYPSYHVPRIAGQHTEYLVAALQAYRAKTRSHPTMQANSALLSDQDIEDIAAWFSALGVSN